MSDEQRVKDDRISQEDVRRIAAAVNLTLPEDRTIQLVQTLSSYLSRAESMRQTDLRKVEPPVLTYDRCGSS